MIVLFVIRIQNGYLATPREGNYRLHSIVKYGCDRGFWLAGEDTFQCEATGCWEPNALPKVRPCRYFNRMWRKHKMTQF